MERYEEAREKALKCISIADHMLTMTYPLLQDPRLLLASIENIFLGLSNAIGSLLYFDRLYKRIPPFHSNFESKFNMFKMKCVPRYDINREYLRFISNVKELVYENKKSPVTFSRKDKFVICADDYKLKTLSFNELKKNLEKAKLFIHEICLVIEKNERIFRKSQRRT
ncbi:hypothetical protein JXB41_00890 [Candidatus Woesearchaeota archaeon]|nr:hypothetical protein [Candidatus Woesearchaeota archaeon]